ncbi:hypothetical protein F0U44_04830 [Nocardioides humilatus]|uniref:Uncharacterized protein n=1 Tax=Nocardioides humilatus TaxID=2607660 RepID=A0A5B1LLG5_9ACTN|nr:hypothetical protein [Nocardioides humilatus]KAA1421605.1 hypothetical protein F0U44_04830 [Nocardioides humilatus]
MDDEGLDPTTGTWRFGGSTCALGPALTRATFDAHPEAGLWSPYAVDEPFCSYRRAAVLCGEPLTVIVWFDGDALRRMTVGTSRAEIVGSGWGEYDLRAGVAFHQRFLERVLGAAVGPFPWGRLSVGVDPVNGTSEIVVDVEATVGA